MEGYRIEPFEDGAGAVGPEALRSLWLSEGLALREREGRRLHEVLLVALHDRDGLVAECSVYLQRSARLRLDLWHLRVFTALEHRMAGLGGALARGARDHLERLYVTGQDTRGAGLATEVEHRGLQTRNTARGHMTGGFFLGLNDRGHPFRVHFFRGAPAPGPPS